MESTDKITPKTTDQVVSMVTHLPDPKLHNILTVSSLSDRLSPSGHSSRAD